MHKNDLPTIVGVGWDFPQGGTLFPIRLGFFRFNVHVICEGTDVIRSTIGLITNIAIINTEPEWKTSYACKSEF